MHFVPEAATLDGRARLIMSTHLHSSREQQSIPSVQCDSPDRQKAFAHVCAIAILCFYRSEHPERYSPSGLGLQQ